MRYHLHLDEVKGDPGAWLRSVAWRLSLDLLRKRKREAVAVASRPGAVTGRESALIDDRVEIDDRLQGAVATLPERQREVLLRRVVEGESFPAIAGALGVSEGSAKTHLRRALDRLKTLLGGER